MSRRDEGEAVVEFSDTGHGICPERLKRIFEPGFGEQRGRVKASLGLASCARIMQAHGGSITATSEGAGKGARFTLRLPLGSAAVAVA